MRAALYIDLDNMLGYCYSLSYRFQPRSLVQYIAEQGDILRVAKSFGSVKSALSHLGFFMGEDAVLGLLRASNIEHVSCAGKKNSADLSLSLEAITDHESYDALYIVSSDADFMPLTEKLTELGKKVVCIRMFQPQNPTEHKGLTEIYYHDILGISVEGGFDVKVLVYRNVIESVLKMPLARPAQLEEIMQDVLEKFVPGQTLASLANSVGRKDAFKILRTALYGKAFLSDASDKTVLLSVRDGLYGLQSAYYRQCQFILRRHLKGPLDEDALNKAFMLKSMRYSLSTRQLEELSDEQYFPCDRA